MSTWVTMLSAARSCDTTGLLSTVGVTVRGGSAIGSPSTKMTRLT